MMKKPSPRTNSDQFFTPAQVGVLIEELRSEFRIFAENQSTLIKKIDIIFEELGRQKEDTFIIKVDIRGLKEGQKRLEDKLDLYKETTDRRLNRLENFLE